MSTLFTPRSFELEVTRTTKKGALRTTEADMKRLRKQAIEEAMQQVGDVLHREAFEVTLELKRLTFTNPNCPRGWSVTAYWPAKERTAAAA